MGLSFLMILNAALASGGHVVGNGGNLVSCPPGERRPSEIFLGDFAVHDLFDGFGFAGSRYRTLASFRGQSLKNAFPAAVRVFAREPSLRRLLMEKFARFERDADFVSDGEIRQFNSSGYAFLRGCETRTVINQIQVPDSFEPNRFSMKIARMRWGRMATDQQIALLFHEYFQARLIQRDVVCSARNVHRIVAFILSDEAAGMPSHLWRDRLPSLCSE